MNHLKIIGIKFIVIAIAVFSIFGILNNASLSNLFWISLLVTGIAYIIGDLFILRKTGNVIASLADFGLAFLSLWVLGSLFLVEGMPVVTLSLLSAFFIACSELLIHAYILNHLDFDHKDTRTMNQLQTEFSEEIDPDMKTDKNQKDKK
ncbi:YndM family protein [Virgibacillus doumboii]|uniref:YndM family protein n=1 Tax=Virgibacillus doumboii TaxID=2697503 RepID=UPI0013DFA57E|nr:YndM family protein [Virgibacillus doumboii]